MIADEESTVPLRAIVFDLWGTLMLEQRDLLPERTRLRYAGVEPVLARLGITVTAEEFQQGQRAANQHVGRLQDEGGDVTSEERARLVIAEFDTAAAEHATDDDVTALIDAFGAAFRATPPLLLPGALDALDEARARGLGVGLISNTGIAGGRHLRHVLADEGLLERFDSLVFSDEHRRAKPAREVFDHALRELDATPAEAVFVGDTPRFDIGPPRRYGWWVVQVRDRDDGDPPAHVRVSGVGDVFPALADLGLLDRAPEPERTP